MKQVKYLFVLSVICCFSSSHINGFSIPGDYDHTYNRAESTYDKGNSWSKSAYESNENSIDDRRLGPERLTEFDPNSGGKPKRNSFWTKKSVGMPAVDSLSKGAHLMKENMIKNYIKGQYNGCMEKCSAISDQCHSVYANSNHKQLSICDIAKQLCMEWCPPIH